jgi:hypothetical protein
MEWARLGIGDWDAGFYTILTLNRHVIAFALACVAA